MDETCSCGGKTWVSKVETGHWSRPTSGQGVILHRPPPLPPHSGKSLHRDMQPIMNPQHWIHGLLWLLWFRIRSSHRAGRDHKGPSSQVLLGNLEITHSWKVLVQSPPQNFQRRRLRHPPRQQIPSTNSPLKRLSNVWAEPPFPSFESIAPSPCF